MSQPTGRRRLRRLRVESLEHRRLLSVGPAPQAHFGFADATFDQAGVWHVPMAEGEPGDLVGIELVARHLDGSGISTANPARVGEPFQLDVYVRDLRTTTPYGVFAAYCDVTFDPNGVSIDWPTIQRLTVPWQAEQGTYTLSFDGEVTAPIAADADARDIRTALEYLPNVEVGDIAVFDAFDRHPGPWNILFWGRFANQQVPLLVGDGSDLRDYLGQPLSSPDNEVQITIDSSNDPADPAYHALPPFVFGEDYIYQRNGDASHAGLIDEVGAVAGSEFFWDGDAHLLFTAQVTATAPGQVMLATDPAEDTPWSDVLMYGLDEPVDPGDVDFGSVMVDIGAFEHVPTLAAARLYYRGSWFEDGSTGDGAIAVDKQPLTDGQTATAENYSNFYAGINGVMVDIDNEDDAVEFSAADFVFRMGNDSEPGGWQPAPVPTSVQTRPGEGVGGSVRVDLAWPNGAIRNTWLQVTVLANENTGLAEDEVFYFGNAVGEVGNDSRNALVSAADLIAIRDNPRGPANRAGIDNPHDVNRDRLVNAIDSLLARNHATGPFDSLRLIAPPAVVAPAPFEGEAERVTLQASTDTGETPAPPERTATRASPHFLNPRGLFASLWDDLRP